MCLQAEDAEGSGHMGANRASVGGVAVVLGAWLIAMSGSTASAAVGGAEGILMPEAGIARSSTVLGARVRITAAPNRRIVGVVTGIDRTTLTIVTDNRSDVTVLLSAITGVERSVGHGPRRPGRGFLAGAGAGAALGFVIGSTSRCPGILAPPGSPATQKCFLEPWGSTLVFGLLGGGGGALVGAFSRPDRWAEVPVTWLEGK